MSGIIVGKYEGQYLIFPGQQFVLVAAPTRSGKGVAIVIPNLLNYEDSVVVLDLKMENYRLTSLFRERNGQKVFLFAPFAEDCITHRWNMLDTVSRSRNTRVGDVLAVGQSLYPSDCDPKDKFWNDNARNLFLAFVLYLMESPELPCTFGEVFRQSSGRGRPIKEYVEGIIKEREDAGKPLSGECLDAFGRFLAAPENTLGNILSTFNAPLLIFANPMVDAATSASDFDINQVRKQRMSIYIGIQPGQLADASLLINMFFSQLINLNTKELPEDNPSLRYACLCVLDEFTSIGKVNIIAKANSFIAGYNVRLLTIVQSIAQLEGVYGEQDTRTLVTNHGLQIMYPPREQKDANDYSEMLGYFTEKTVSKGNSNSGGFSAGSVTRSENTSENRRALMLPQELKEMPQDEEFILMENTKPIRCHKARYFNDHVFIDRLKSVSPSLAALDGVGWRAYARKFGLHSMAKVLPTSSQLKHAAFIRKEMSSAVPFVDVDLHKAKMEGRMRPLEEGEPVDAATLAINVAALPAIDNPADPSQKQVGALVEAFFSELEWGAEEHDEPAPAVAEVSGGWIEKGHNVASVALPAMAGADSDET
ncbi:type IV secretory system conjugative DNA transfer family protein [Massilia pseudoviolaceinigra]|uniref:type IV secretory system conjugative DNA transfer family protein n=1 Tax=Massilia pseudoviolaceinigra TaxID=3057165 RepID=UPI0027964219|nr:type IV secretory system conjugative DNA transfer family protein [Massilia sp. CCM 9206]MDQ1922672.1 type IV secretory system conjugative DNA transfer family protein [Massilia sp. CCM 9206]